MTNNRHYVYIDSRNRNPHEQTNNFTVHLNNALKNVVRCGVVSFTCPNTSYNVVHTNRIIRWFEIHHITGIGYFYRTFEIELTIGYKNISDLLSEITTKMNSTGSRALASETITSYSFGFDPDYRVELSAAASSSVQSNRWWGFLVEDDEQEFNHSILHNVLSLSRSQILTQTQLDTIANKEGEASPSGLKTPVGVFISAIHQSQTVYDVALSRTLKAPFSYSENNPLIHLASNMLSENSTRLVTKNGISFTQKTNVLEQIPITVNRWSWVQMSKSANEILWHSLDNINLTHFDLQLLNDHYNMYLEGATHVEYKACICFETVDADNSDMIEMYKAYNASGYSQAHSTRR